MTLTRASGCVTAIELPHHSDGMCWVSDRACKFNHTAALECPFHTSGTYSVNEVEECKPFMRVRTKPYRRQPLVSIHIPPDKQCPAPNFSDILP